MSDFNKVIIMGRLTEKPEVRFTPGGEAVTTLRVASSSRFKTKAGDDKEETCFIDATVWRKQAETCGEFLVKGQRVLVEGRLVLRQWETADKEKRRAHEIQAQRVIFLEKPRGAAGTAAAGDKPLPGDEEAPAPGGDDDIPF